MNTDDSKAPFVYGDVPEDLTHLQLLLRKCARPEYTIERAYIVAFRPDARAILYDWFCSMRREYNNCGRCLAWTVRAVRLLDRFASSPDSKLEGKTYQLYGSVCFSLAHKLFDFGQGQAIQNGVFIKPERKIPNIVQEMVDCSAGAFSFDHFLIAEVQVLHALRDFLMDATPLDFLYLPEICSALSPLALTCAELLLDLFTVFPTYPVFSVPVVANSILRFLFGLRLCEQEVVSMLPANTVDDVCLSSLFRAVVMTNHDLPGLASCYTAPLYDALITLLRCEQSRGYLAVASFEADTNSSVTLSAKRKRSLFDVHAAVDETIRSEGAFQKAERLDQCTSDIARCFRPSDASWYDADELRRSPGSRWSPLSPEALCSPASASQATTAHVVGGTALATPSPTDIRQSPVASHSRGAAEPAAEYAASSGTDVVPMCG